MPWLIIIYYWLYRLRLASIEESKLAQQNKKITYNVWLTYKSATATFLNNWIVLISHGCGSSLIATIATFLVYLIILVWLLLQPTISRVHVCSFYCTCSIHHSPHTMCLNNCMCTLMKYMIIHAQNYSMMHWQVHLSVMEVNLIIGFGLTVHSFWMEIFWWQTEIQWISIGH